MSWLCSAAAGEDAEQDDLFEWDPKAKQDVQDSEAAPKRKRDGGKEPKQRKKKAPGLSTSVENHTEPALSTNLPTWPFLKLGIATRSIFRFFLVR